VPPVTASPVRLTTGNGSPRKHGLIHVRVAIQNHAVHRNLFARATRTGFAQAHFFIGMSISLPSRTTRAVRGCRPIRRLMACEVLAACTDLEQLARG